MTVVWGAALAAGILLVLSPWLWPVRERDESPRRDGRVSRMLDEAGFAHASTMRPVLIAVVLCALFCAISWLVTGLGAVAVVAALAGAAAPFAATHTAEPVAASTPDGVSARVTVAKTWRPPVLTLFVPDGWPLESTATSRTALR